MFGAFAKAVAIKNRPVPSAYKDYDFRCSICRQGIEVRWHLNNGTLNPEAWKMEVKRHGDSRRHGGEATRDGKIVRIGNDGTLWKDIKIISESR